MIRRHFLSLWAAVLVLPVWRKRSVASGRSSSVRELLWAWAATRSEGGHAMIGRKAASLGLVSSDADVLLTGLENRVRTASPSPGEEESFERLLARMVSDDFGNDQMIEVDGWLLSATEVELCTVAAIARTRRRQNGRLRPNALM